VDEHTLLIPDRRGNNRIDSLRNLVRDPRISLLFLIPGVGETMRINGRAAISTDPKLTESFVFNGKAPKCVLVVTVERAYFQCTKAIIRSKLWDPATQVDRKTLPTPGIRNNSEMRGSRTRLRRLSMRLLPRRSGMSSVCSSTIRTKPGGSPRGEQSSPSGPQVASTANGAASISLRYCGVMRSASLNTAGP
jgi:hypothetical protein